MYMCFVVQQLTMGSNHKSSVRELALSVIPVNLPADNIPPMFTFVVTDHSTPQMTDFSDFEVSA